MRDIDAIWEVSHAGETSTCLKRIQWVSKNAFSGKAWFCAVSDGSWWIYVAICSDLWTRSRPSFRADFRKGQTHRWNVCSALQCNFHRPWHLALRTFAGMWRIVEGAWDMHGICILDHFGSFWELTIFERRVMLATWPTARCRSSVMCVVPALSRPSWMPSALALKRQPNRRNIKER